MAFLDSNSRGLHANDMITLRTNMHGCYAQVDGIPQYIIMLEEAQKKAKRAIMPIADIELVMMALVAAARLTIGKGFPLTHTCGGRGRWHSISPTSSASVISWPQGGGSLSAGLMVCFLRRGW